MNTSAVIELEKLSKTYSTEEMETYALSEVDLCIASGEYVSIAGPSGCGKSTLLSILGLLDTPSGGRYRIEGDDVTTLDMEQRAALRNRRIGFVFQAFNLIDELNVFENVALPLRFRDPAMDSRSIHERVMICLDRVQMSHRAKHHPNQLSGGQQQRTAIARALVGEPAILLVDEPTGNLDSSSGDAVMDLLETCNEAGTTLCMVTHDPRYAHRARRQLHLLDGRLVDNNAGAVA
jgi:putative ABC transport system ATP-binding protein